MKQILLFILFSLFVQISKGQTFSLNDSILNEGDSLIKNISFNFNNNSILPESKKFLDSLELFLTKYTFITIEIEHHTDTRGSKEYNKKLSEHRARSIYDYLLSKNIKKERLNYKGIGESKPIITQEKIELTNDKESREKLYAINRRTVFRITSIKYK